MKKIGTRPQRTIAGPAETCGLGFLNSAPVHLRFQPAPPDTGVVFVRTDVRPVAEVAARIENVTGTRRRTTLGSAPVQVALVEHVLAALAGLRIDNCYVEVDGPEAPGMDGSARDFVLALTQAGIVMQSARRAIWTVEETVVVQAKNASLALHPAEADEFKISYFLDYGLGSPLGRQVYTGDVTPESFAAELADCRTFLLETEAAEMRRQGIGEKIKPSDLLVVGPRGPIDNSYRHANEPARHKVLDIIGDLSLFGQDLRGHVTACRSGHPLNAELVRTLANSMAVKAGVPMKRAA